MVGLTNNKFKIVDGYIRFSWKKLYPLNHMFRTRIPDTAKINANKIYSQKEFIM